MRRIMILTIGMICLIFIGANLTLPAAQAAGRSYRQPLHSSELNQSQYSRKPGAVVSPEVLKRSQQPNPKRKLDSSRPSARSFVDARLRLDQKTSHEK